MVGAEVQRRLTWTIAEVVELIDENPTMRSIVFAVPGWEGHLAGQHIDIRLTAEDGYQAQRSYSIADPVDGEMVTITVELIEDGEVSPYLMQELVIGDRVEIRGPIGGYFVWDPSVGDPVQLIGGGSGVVPLMSILRTRFVAGSDAQMRYLSSARTQEHLLHVNELDELRRRDSGISVVHTLTRSHPDDWSGPTRRVDRAMLEEFGWPASQRPLSFVCGPTGFVETVASTLVDLGHDPERIKTERFGPTGG